jgi:DNA-directed RNA polymerase specialized sigma24 family protein
MEDDKSRYLISPGLAEGTGCPSVREAVGEPSDRNAEPRELKLKLAGLDTQCSTQESGPNTPLNFDTRSYRFEDPDLEMAVSRLPRRDQNILILRLMGHKQRDIARVSGVTRSMISKRLSMITEDLKRSLVTDETRINAEG